VRAYASQIQPGAKKPSKAGPRAFGKKRSDDQRTHFPRSLPRYDTTRDTHTSTPESQKLRRPVIHGCTLYFFACSLSKHQVQQTSASEIEIERSVPLYSSPNVPTTTFPTMPPLIRFVPRRFPPLSVHVTYRRYCKGGPG
jgi:hypothetical protein